MYAVRVASSKRGVAVVQLAEVDAEHHLAGGDEEERVVALEDPVEARLVVLHVDHLLHVERERLEARELTKILQHRGRRTNDAHLGGGRRLEVVDRGVSEGGDRHEGGRPGEARELEGKTARRRGGHVRPT